MRLAPRYRAGQTLHYQIDFRAESWSHTSGAVENPEGAAQIDLAVTLLVRMEVLSTLPAFAADSAGAARAAAAAPPRRVRLRATYEKSSVVLSGDSYDPAAGELEAQYRKLAGRAVEFTLEADGKIEEITGLDEILRDERSLAAAREWLGQLAASSGFPPQGISLGESWTRKKHMEDSPLKDTALDTHSTYARNEKCRGGTETGAAANFSSASPAGLNSAAIAPSADSTEMCAVVVTRYEMKQQGKSRRPGDDATPEALRKRGLRSSGTWTSAGESLSYVSLATGLTVSVTQSGTEQMNMSVQRSAGGAPFQYETKARTETHLTLLPEPAPAPHP